MNNVFNIMINLEFLMVIFLMYVNCVNYLKMVQKIIFSNILKNIIIPVSQNCYGIVLFL